MASNSSADRRNPPDAPASGSTLQQVVTLLIILHLVCVAVALASYTRRSALQARLLNLFAPYTRTLGFDPYLAPYHLTQYDAMSGAGEFDDELYLEIEITAANGETETHDLKSFGLATPDAQRRFRYYAVEMAFAVSGEDSDSAGEFARSAGGFALRRLGVDVGVLRLKRHMSQPRSLAEKRPEFPDDPLAAPYILTQYEADVLLDDDGEVQVIKREARGQVAPAGPANTRSGSAPKSNPSGGGKE